MSHLEDTMGTKLLNFRSHVRFYVVLVLDEVVPKPISAKQASPLSDNPVMVSNSPCNQTGSVDATSPSSSYKKAAQCSTYIPHPYWPFVPTDTNKIQWETTEFTITLKNGEGQWISMSHPLETFKILPVISPCVSHHPKQRMWRAQGPTPYPSSIPRYMYFFKAS